MDFAELTAQLKNEARHLGFPIVGTCRAVEPNSFDRLQQWVGAGYAGEMDYLANRLEAYRHPRSILPDVQSLLMVAMPYQVEPFADPGPGCGKVARYAQFDCDYHDLIRAKLRRLAAVVHRFDPSIRTRGVVDTAPLLERDFATLAGLGWIGKNTMLINQRHGSWLLLAALLLTCPLQYDQPTHRSHCGNCTACLDACPTGALLAPRLLDARRCISYQTIEQRGWSASDEPTHQAAWVFGCDICQEVCPWNRNVPPVDVPGCGHMPDLNPAPVAQWFHWQPDQLQRTFEHTALWRGGRAGLLRNAAIVLADQPVSVALEPLTHGLDDADALVRRACAWALGQLGDPQARNVLQRRLQHETDGDVREEIGRALS